MKFKCDQCDFHTTDPNSLLDHILIVHDKEFGEVDNYCMYCNEYYDSYNDLINHNKENHDDANSEEDSKSSSSKCSMNSIIDEILFPFKITIFLNKKKRLIYVHPQKKIQNEYVKTSRLSVPSGTFVCQTCLQRFVTIQHLNEHYAVDHSESFNTNLSLTKAKQISFMGFETLHKLNIITIPQKRSQLVCNLCLNEYSIHTCSFEDLDEEFNDTFNFLPYSTNSSYFTEYDINKIIKTVKHFISDDSCEKKSNDDMLFKLNKKRIPVQMKCCSNILCNVCFKQGFSKKSVTGLPKCLCCLQKLFSEDSKICF